MCVTPPRVVLNSARDPTARGATADAAEEAPDEAADHRAEPRANRRADGHPQDCAPEAARRAADVLPGARAVLAPTELPDRDQRRVRALVHDEHRDRREHVAPERGPRGPLRRLAEHLAPERRRRPPPHGHLDAVLQGSLGRRASDGLAHRGTTLSGRDRERPGRDTRDDGIESALERRVLSSVHHEDTGLLLDLELKKGVGVERGGLGASVALSSRHFQMQRSHLRSSKVVSPNSLIFCAIPV